MEKTSQLYVSIAGVYLVPNGSLNGISVAGDVSFWLCDVILSGPV